ncbi:MAG: hypothetical protein K6F51_02520 [Acetatifactor sp.]|nr:hypothetical protein [Acetatifactor sp.]
MKKAAEILCATFPDGDVYRAGGDEFMVIVMGMDEEMVEERRKRPTNASHSSDFYAVGKAIFQDNLMFLRTFQSFCRLYG